MGEKDLMVEVEGREGGRGANGGGGGEGGWERRI